MYSNPAAIAFMQRTSISIASTLESQGKFLEHVAVTPLYADRVQALTMGFAQGGFGSMWSKPYFSDYGADVAYARKFGSTFSAGALLSYRDSKGKRKDASAVSTAMGVFYSPTPGISYGFTYAGLGQSLLASYDSTSYSLKQELSPPQAVEIGATWKYPSAGQRSTVALNFASRKVFGQSQTLYKGGLELSPWRWLALRGGVATEPGTVAFRTGVGFMFSSFRIDYAVSPGPSPDRFHQLTLSVSLAEQ
jgi:hypothetical protein